MSEGTYWIYRGAVYSANNQDGELVTKVTWKTEVRKLIRRGNLTAAVINGFPSDLNWSDGNPKPGDSLLIRSGQDDYYLIGPDPARQSIKTFADNNASLDELLSDDDLFLRLPLKQGAKFCDPESLARDDGMYCSFVSSVDPVLLKDVKGIPPGTRKAYEIRYVTNPDDITFRLVPGVGIISYDYHHHGTVADTELMLVEFHLGGKDPASITPHDP
ncbi:MAG TPA: hypothetical protein VEX69_07505 [Candidatus Limnocylindria bacterium]|nr:hypothetical protein [Candidatus Limnocylindria bacterium]